MDESDEYFKPMMDRYIYAYDDEPDGTMHEIGNDTSKVIELIKERNFIVKAMGLLIFINKNDVKFFFYPLCSILYLKV